MNDLEKNKIGKLVGFLEEVDGYVVSLSWDGYWCVKPVYGTRRDPFFFTELMIAAEDEFHIDLDERVSK